MKQLLGLVLSGCSCALLAMPGSYSNITKGLTNACPNVRNLTTASQVENDPCVKVYRQTHQTDIAINQQKRQLNPRLKSNYKKIDCETITSPTKRSACYLSAPQ